MKNTLLATAIAFAASSALAGTLVYEEPPQAEMVMEEETGGSMGSSGSWVIPVLALIAVVILISNDDDSSSSQSVSDARLKADIRQVGMSDIGLPIYQFRYVGRSQQYTGVMAQDVLEHTPEAVTRGPFGFYVVDYGMLGLEMTTVD